MSRRRRTGREVHGILLLDKRQGVSSNAALQEVRRLFAAKKAGHTGSLDPLATGLLPVCFGEATKISGLLLDDDKRYRVVIRLGVVTDTGDAEGKVLSTQPVPIFERHRIDRCLAKFTGCIEQVPPMYSALKHQGKRLYELAREGQEVQRKPRRITVHRIECLDYAGDLLTLDVSCSKGTYIRTLAEDIGADLDCGASVKELRRLAVGGFSIDAAWTLKQLQALDDTQRLQCLQPVDQALLAWPKIILDRDLADRIRQGQKIVPIEQLPPGMVRIYTAAGILGIGEIDPHGGLAPRRLFRIQGNADCWGMNSCADICLESGKNAVNRC